MAIKFEKIQPGMKLWSKQRRMVGNTTGREDAWFPVLVLEVDVGNRCVYASTNNNPGRWVPERHATKWYSDEAYAKAKAKGAKR